MSGIDAVLAVTLATGPTAAVLRLEAHVIELKVSTFPCGTHGEKSSHGTHHLCINPASQSGPVLCLDFRTCPDLVASSIATATQEGSAREGKRGGRASSGPGLLKLDAGVLRLCMRDPAPAGEEHDLARMLERRRQVGVRAIRLLPGIGSGHDDVIMQMSQHCRS